MPTSKDEGEVIFRMFITRNGKRIYRKDRRPWRIVIRDKKQ
jgi:hypothetical protein